MGWASEYAQLRDPRVVYRHGNHSIARIPAPENEVPFTVLVPIVDAGSHLWESIYGLSFQRYSNWAVIFVCSTPDLKHTVVSTLKCYRQYLPENDIFVPKREIDQATMLNVALGLAKTDYICLKAAGDHMHASALAAMSEIIAAHKADFYHTLRYRINDWNWICCEPAIPEDELWSGKHIHPRGLYTFNKTAVISSGGFKLFEKDEITDSTLELVYEMCDSENAYHVPAYLYLSRYMKKPSVRADNQWSVTARRDLIAERWPHRVSSD
jgi:hypothetical protein